MQQSTAPMGQSLNQSYNMPMQYQQQMAMSQPWNAIKVDGPNEAMNRFLMHYPANQLMPNFISEPLFDINGRQFHVLSIEADGRRNLETFDYSLHEDEQKVQINGAEFASKREFDELARKVYAVMEVVNGLHAAVPATTVNADTETSGTQGQDVNAAADNAGRHLSTHQQSGTDKP